MKLFGRAEKVAVINYFKMKFYHVVESVQSNGFQPFLREIIYLNREAILAEKDLLKLEPWRNDSKKKEYAFVEVGAEILGKKGFLYAYRHRYLKALRYTMKDYRGYALLKGNEVIGDVWYFAKKPGNMPDHADLKWLDINLGEKEVYAFDLFLDPTARGNGIATLFQKAFLRDLQGKGFEKVYGFVWKDNRPALWLYRMLKYKELEKKRVTRLLCIKKRMGRSSAGVAAAK